jgi:hypothetical protein
MPNNDRTLLLTVAGVTHDEGNFYANDLQDFLVDFDPNLRLEKRRERPDTQDFGSTLVLVLGTTAATALASGIASWMRRNAGARISVRKSTGELIAEGLDSRDVPRIVQALSDVL